MCFLGSSGLLLSVIFYMIYYSLGADFLQVPTDVNTTLVTDSVTFHCRTNSSETYWLVNGNSPPNTVAFGSQTVDGIKSLYLTVPARKAFNNSMIECVIDLPGGGEKHSTPAFLRFQGLLEAVENLQVYPSRNAIHLTWIEPVSLNITGTEPDVWYHIIVTKMSSTPTTQLSLPMEGSLQITGSEYVYMESHPDPCSVYEFSVVPVNTVGEGKRASIISSFFEEPQSITAEDVIITYNVTPLPHSKNCQVNVTTEFHVSYCPGKVPDSFHIYLQSVSSIMPLVYVYHTEDISLTLYVHDNATTRLSLTTTELVWGEKYNMIIEAENEAGSKNSTGDIEIYVPQRPYLSSVLIELTNDARVCITCKFKSAITTEAQENCTAELLSPANASFLSTLHITVLPLQSQLTEAKDCFNVTLSEGNYTVEIHSELIALCRSAYSMEFEVKWETEMPDLESPTESNIFHPSNIHCSVTCIIGTAIGTGICLIAILLVVVCVLLGKKLRRQGNGINLKQTQIELTSNACYGPGSVCTLSSNVCYSSTQPTGETNDALYEEIPS